MIFSDWKLSDRTAALIAAGLALALFLTTLQVGINGSNHPYVTDVGEIQNALPRWGTLHFTGYPQYTALGSFFVTLLRLVGVPPAAGASLYSAVWGALAIGLLVLLARQFGVSPVAAVLTALLFGLSTSMWMDASIAELHTMTMALTLATLFVALRFSRTGSRRAMYWLAFLSGQGLAHQRSFAFLGLALLILAWPHWKKIFDHFLTNVGLFLLGPLTYLYLPLVDWLGADWVFSNPATWEGFRALVLDTKADRIVTLPQTTADWLERGRIIFGLLAQDWPLWLLALGLAGLCVGGRVRNGRERAALALVWLPYLLLSFFIWEGYVSDALLAVNLPVLALAALGLGFWTQWAGRKRPPVGHALTAAWLVAAVVLFVNHRPAILKVTRDPSARETIELAARIEPAGRPTTLMALWGHDFWQLAYAQAYESYFPTLNLVDHNADFQAILARGDRFLVLGRTFYLRPLAWWEARLGPLALSSAAPEIVELHTTPTVEEPAAAGADPLGNGVALRDSRLRWVGADTLLVSVTWQAQQADLVDYSVAVHLVAQDPPAGPQDIVAQADRSHPVGGWYPTSRWTAGEVVRDHYLLDVPPGAEPASVRISMYRRLEDGQFENSKWISLPLPAESQ